MRKQDSEQEEINNIITLLQKLEIEQTRLSENIAHARNTVDKLIHDKETKTNTNTNNNKERTTRAFRVVKPDIGDRIRIINPRRNQQNEGVVQGFTITGYVKINLHDGTTVRRLPKNILKLEYYE